MPNTSATGGPLQPAAMPAPLEGQSLNRLLQTWVVGITGLSAALVRPRWQTEPPDIPDAGTAWASIGVMGRDADAFPAVVHSGAGDGADTLQRNETFTLLCSFYDTGTNGFADQYAALLRDGSAIAQNREALLPDIFLVSCGEAVPVPSLLKTLWLYRVDLPVVLRRQITRVYPVLNVLEAVGTIAVDPGSGDAPLIIPFDVPTT